MSTDRKLVPTRVLRHPDGRFRGLALEREGWARLQLPVGARVIVETGREDITFGHVVIDKGERMIRAVSLEDNDLRFSAFVRRPGR